MNINHSTNQCRYCIATNTWENLPDLPQGYRQEHASVAFRVEIFVFVTLGIQSYVVLLTQGKIYVIGGIGPTNSKLQRKCEAFDPYPNLINNMQKNLFES